MRKKSLYGLHNPASFQHYHLHEHDACGVVSVMEKKRIPTKANIDLCIDALITMNHRAGFINGEGDGVGIHMDLPKALWQEKLQRANIDTNLLHREDFVVGHIFIKRHTDVVTLQQQMKQQITDQGFHFLYETQAVTQTDALGPLGKVEEPIFWQIAFIPENPTANLDATLFDLTISFEQSDDIHVASLSTHHVVYKVMGAGDTLVNYYTDLSNPLIASTMTLGHNRYSTNTLSTFFRVQPFSILGHNGEINTISTLRDQAEMLNVPLTNGGSDSQDLNRVIDTLLSKHSYSLFEALEILFPPIVNEIKAYETAKQDVYTYIREAWGHFAQGPAGIISRHKDEAVFSVDSLGLRPLWKLETESSYIFASEQGVVLPSEYVAEPKTLAPGEKVGLKWAPNGMMLLYSYETFQKEVQARLSNRLVIDEYHQNLTLPAYGEPTMYHSNEKVETFQYAAFGWDREHIQLLEQMAEKGVEPIRSLGHDAPLAALDPERRNIADFLKESVAVVTNPAIDRDREVEHFSTRVIIGKRPSLYTKQSKELIVELPSPILVEGKHGYQLANEQTTASYEQLLGLFEEKQAGYVLSATFSPNESIEEAIQRLTKEAITAVQNGAHLLVLDDKKAHNEDHLWFDPHLIVASLNDALVENQLRRHCSLLLRSGAIRSLHDFITAFGLGADAISPYLMFATVYEEEYTPTSNLYSALTKGLEKVISTIGIHELRGYGRLFSAIGLHNDIANTLNVPNFLGSNSLAYDFASMKEDARKRQEDYHNEKTRMRKTFHIFPRVWKAIGEVARSGAYDDYRQKLQEIEEATPISIRHLTNIQPANKQADSTSVSLSVGTHDLPFIISSMSFGSQNEVAFRAYAEAADQLNMISLNGEGGEIKDMIGKYPNTRGQQIASGRFGVNADLLNSSNLLEIKIGQGAKPGEGGHLPGSKVTEKIAEARNATKGSDLISPSNNHDIYSIEDLAQMISELKTANDKAKVAVKVPVVPNIGTIAVGIAKAGADFINISGFDGGTGAARIHALSHVGLPVEIGVKAAHNALLEAGMREQVEIWADGGVRSALDTMRLMLLGANRIGFGTLSMIAIGCTTCRGCHLDTCHVGIATQIESEAQAKEHGLRRFVPRDYTNAIQGLMNLFTAFGEELKKLTASLGYTDAQQLVGRSDLLVQTSGVNQLNLAPLLDTLAVHSEQHTSYEQQANIPAESLDFDVEQLRHSRTYEQVGPTQRNLGSRVACFQTKEKQHGNVQTIPTTLHYANGSVPGNGLGAYTSEHVHIHVNGGAQDGVGKTAAGSNIYVLKSKGKDGNYYSGSVGKGFGYGAQRGYLVVQGNADARAGIRLSGADMLIGGSITTPIPEMEHGNIGVHANIKGFAFEYMTNGRAIVLGDPGPWMCAGMTGGVVYVRHQPEMGLTIDAIKRRIAKGAKVAINSLSQKGMEDVTELLSRYHNTLIQHAQHEEAEKIAVLLQDAATHFIELSPVKEQADPSVSTE
ncbi:glutamate synthase-related protein [Priestia taiwanensis]|uniref:Glutamate synthase n=1 Tax=Priestia taiwanensis TaxID=1347902 RepID=A0A917AV01_9BACI|nr:glutamate synthase-related protein [Priestia taiwanensis]MBM7364621.1 glutamate synthase (NADPH/NADH) large chain [Priestia taiwanensis]GGE78251.1 glutamate synthase [Priestia taiwanensis]